jgi:hypothetical protein
MIETEYHFFLHDGYVDSEAVEKILQDAGIEAWHTNYTEPHGKKRGWFSCVDYGFSSNRDTESRAREVISIAGGLDRFLLSSTNVYADE